MLCSASSTSSRILIGGSNLLRARLLRTPILSRVSSPVHDSFLSHSLISNHASLLNQSFPVRCHLSTSADVSVARPDAPPPRRRKLETKDPIVVTERAAGRIKEILTGDSAKGALGIRLGVKRRGCNGLSYTLNYAFEKPEKDLEMQSNGITVFIEPMALFSVVGTTMDWEETELSSEFTFNNPNSKGECGCGESFTV